jgi:DNA integrity scanning protein DisA with diadenylate cyclase activity
MDLSLLTPRELTDVAVSALIVFVLLESARSARNVLMLFALLLLTGAYALASSLGYTLSAHLLLALVISGVVYGVFISHDDVRRWFDRAAGWFGSRGTPRDAAGLIGMVVAAAERMAESRTGALIVLPGLQPLGREAEGGLELDANLSVPLLLSLFDPSSPGHDGAVIIRHGRVAEFAVHLPLSTNHDLLGERGTRHAAALGLSEGTDALCVVVSEERGEISIAKGGVLRSVSGTELSAELGRHLAGRPERTRVARGRWKARVAHVALAILAATGGWFAAIQGGQAVTRTLSVPVMVQGLPEGYTVVAAEPESIDVTISGPRNRLLLLSDRDIDLGIDGWAVANGRRTFLISPMNVSAGPDVEVRLVEPRHVRVEVSGPTEVAQRP